jgi:hypothetical protein
MNEPLFLYMMLLGCRPAGRLIEQHDMYFGIGSSMKDLVPQIKNFWPEAKGVMHVDAWRRVSQVGNYKIEVVERTTPSSNLFQLFFINLGGYQPGEFDEFHYKMLVVANNKSEAIHQSKQTVFYKNMGYKGAESHIDDKYGVDVDEIFEIHDILSNEWKAKYQLRITENPGPDDEINLGYFKLDKL